MASKRKRIILDTNIWISFLITKDFSKLDKTIFSGDTVLIFSQELLEEFVRREIVGKEKVDDFRDVYKNPEMFACIFLLTPEDMEFIFCPYDIDADIKGLL